MAAPPGLSSAGLSSVARQRNHIGFGFVIRRSTMAHLRDKLRLARKPERQKRAALFQHLPRPFLQLRRIVVMIAEKVGTGYLARSPWRLAAGLAGQQSAEFHRASTDADRMDHGHFPGLFPMPDTITSGVFPQRFRGRNTFTLSIIINILRNIFAHLSVPIRLSGIGVRA